MPHGYDQTVIPEIMNAVLARHDFILLGLRGQAKTRIHRQLAGFLDPWMPVLKDSEINDHPYRPVSALGRRMIEEAGDEAEIDWIPRELRYHEKLATPDVTIADLIGDIDPVKAAKLKLSFGSEDAIHFWLIPRANLSIFAINELPDLQPRIQVGLLNIMQEQDIQIRGFPILKSRAQAALRQDQADLSRTMSRYLESLISSEEDRRRCSRFQDLNHRWFSEAEGAMKLAESGRREDAVTLMNTGPLAELGPQANEVMGEWIRHNETLATAFGEETFSAIRASRRNLLIAVGLVMVLSGALGLVTYRKIAVPIQALRESVEAIAAGYCVHAVPFTKESHELGGAAIDSQRRQVASTFSACYHQG